MGSKMIQKNSKVALIFLCSLSTVSLLGTRHSRDRRIKNNERRAQVVITDDYKLQNTLNKSTKLMTFEEAILAKNHYLEKKDLEMVLKCGQRALAVGGDKANDKERAEEVICQTRMELAEIFLQKQNYKEAEKHALDYQKFYPGSELAVKAAYIAIRSNYLAQPNSDKDQEKTQTTVTMAKEFLTKHKDATMYVPEVKEMLRQSYQKLVRNEIHIIDTLINGYNNTSDKGVLEAAIKRLAYCKEQYVPHAPETKKKLDELEVTLTRLSGNKEGLIKLEESQAQALTNQTSATQAPSQPKKTGFYESIKSSFIENNDEFFT